MKKYLEIVVSNSISSNPLLQQYVAERFALQPIMSETHGIMRVLRCVSVF